MIKKFKHIFLTAMLFAAASFTTFAQTTYPDTDSVKKVAPNNWYQLDKGETGYYGISLGKAYDFLKNRKSKTVLVAVIDSGVDTTQEDLKPVLWQNPGEIPGNGIDDDKNGYIDDVYGWNFIGGKDGRNVHQDSYEAARVYWKLKPKFESGNSDSTQTPPDTTKMNDAEKFEYATYLKAKENVVGASNPAELMMIKRLLPIMLKGDSIIAKDLGKTEFNGNDLKT